MFFTFAKVSESFFMILCYFAGQEFNLVRSFTVAAASSPTSLLSLQLTALKGEFIQQLHAGLVSPRLTTLKGGFIQQLHSCLLSPQLTALKGEFIQQLHACLLSLRLSALKGGFTR
jgi:hypothetical protein